MVQYLGLTVCRQPLKAEPAPGFPVERPGLRVGQAWQGELMASQACPVTHHRLSTLEPSLSASLSQPRKGRGGLPARRLGPIPEGHLGHRLRLGFLENVAPRAAAGITETECSWSLLGTVPTGAAHLRPAWGCLVPAKAGEGPSSRPTGHKGQ